MTKGIVFEFLDMGQGDSTLVQFPPWDSGEIWVVDHGKKWTVDTPADDALAFLIKRISLICRNKKSARPYIDRLIITHPDGDHWNRLGNLIEGYTGTADSKTKQDLWATLGNWDPGTRLTINKTAVGGAWSVYAKKNKALAELIVQTNGDVEPNSLPRDFYSRPDKPWYGPPAQLCKVYVLSSSLSGGKGSPNPDSIVLLFEFDGRKVILTGDAETKIAETEILKRYELDGEFLKSHALKLGHHGSNGASGQPWLDKVQPAVVFASGDKKWGHPYDGPFKRAQKYLQPLPDFPASVGLHRFCVSQSDATTWVGWLKTFGDLTNDYQNLETKDGACTNLWYVVKDTKKLGEMFRETPPYPRIEKEEKQGLYTGVQWRLQIDPGSAPYVMCTNQWPLLDNQRPNADG